MLIAVLKSGDSRSPLITLFLLLLDNLGSPFPKAGLFAGNVRHKRPANRGRGAHAAVMTHDGILREDGALHHDVPEIVVCPLLYSGQCFMKLRRFA